MKNIAAQLESYCRESHLPEEKQVNVCCLKFTIFDPCNLKLILRMLPSHRFWDAKDEIDIVALYPEGMNLILGECKFWQTPVGIHVLRDLKAKTASVAWKHSQRKVWYMLFSASVFTEEIKCLANARENLLLQGGQAK